MVMKTNDLDWRLEEFLNTYLEDQSFEEFLEEFDLTPLDVVLILYHGGHIDDAIIDETFPHILA